MNQLPVRMALPAYMTKFEAREAARRMLQVTDAEDPSISFLGLVILYTSWEVDAPCGTDVADVLSRIPELAALNQGAAKSLLRIRPQRVATALGRGVSAQAALDTLNQACQLSDDVFHGDWTFRELYARTQGLLLRSPAIGAYLGGAMVVLGKAPSLSVATVPAAPGPINVLALRGSVSAPDMATGPTLKLFEPREATLQLQRISVEESNPALKRILLRMERESSTRALTPVPMLQVLDELEARFPHFATVLQFFRLSLALSATGGQNSSVRVPPVLLRGSPGTGKSYFAQELAKSLGCAYEERDFSVTSEAFVLTGMDSSWKNSKAGLVFDALFHGPSANPVICLNEVDKTKTSGSSNSPMTSLYSLLEPANARRFKDEFIGVTVDASKIVWVLTANDGEIPEPVLSRLEVFEIPAPSLEQSRQIAHSVWANLQETDFPAGHPFPAVLEQSLCDEVARLSPRLMRKALTRAAGQAALAGRVCLDLTDLSTARAVYAPSTRAPLGFLG